MSGLTVVAAPSGTVVGSLTNGYTYDLKNSLSVRADPISDVGSVIFKLDGKALPTDNAVPYSVAGNNNGVYTAWIPTLGVHTLIATPYRVDNGHGTAGNSLTISFTVVKTAGTPTPTPTATPTATPEPTGTPTPTPEPAPVKSLVNVSTRVQVQGGDNVLIGGFIVTGDKPKSVVLRGIGPSLAAAGVHGAMSDPSLELYDSTGELIELNDDWTSLPAASVPEGLAPSNPKESLIATSLEPGNYTVVLRGGNRSTGVGLFELYDIDPANSQVSNISTRGVVESGDGAMIAGFIIGGVDPAKVIVRAIGPSLSEAGVSGELLDPILELRDAEGSLIFSNDNWRSDQERAIIATTIPPTSNKEAAIVATLPPGNYTATVRGVDDSTGVALVEVYSLPNP